MTTPPLTNEDKTRLLAEAVGWNFIPSHDEWINGQMQAVPDRWFLEDDEAQLWAHEPPAFLTDANAALTLMEFAKGRGWYVNIYNGDNWDICIFRGRGDHMVWHQAKAPTLPLAIAHAFARAFSLEGNWEDDL